MRNLQVKHFIQYHPRGYNRDVQILTTINQSDVFNLTD